MEEKETRCSGTATKMVRRWGVEGGALYAESFRRCWKLTRRMAVCVRVCVGCKSWIYAAPFPRGFSFPTDRKHRNHGKFAKQKRARAREPPPPLHDTRRGRAAKATFVCMCAAHVRTCLRLCVCLWCFTFKMAAAVLIQRVAICFNLCTPNRFAIRD